MASRAEGKTEGARRRQTTVVTASRGVRTTCHDSLLPECGYNPACVDDGVTGCPWNCHHQPFQTALCLQYVLAMLNHQLVGSSDALINRRFAEAGHH